MVLILSTAMNLWRAPVPWLHNHEGAEPAKLARHAAAFHPDADEKGWHVHVAMLGDITRGAGCPIPAEKNDEDPVEEEPTLAEVCQSPDRVITRCAFGMTETPVPTALSYLSVLKTTRVHVTSRAVSLRERLALICVCRC